jgi:outer membrane receptor protein involved in Fe transport
MINRRIHRAVLTASASAAALLTFAAPGYAMAQSATYTFDIPSQDISAALVAYGQAARQQLVFDGTAVRQKRSSALVGEYSAEEGLEQLLSGTGLKAQFVGSGAVRIVDASGPQSGSAAGGGAEVEALIVTAQKREEDIQDVPIAISAFSQEDLTRSQVAGGPDLITQVPNMTFTKTNFSSYSIQLRGIGTQAISATTDPAVAVAFNNTPFIRNRFFEQEFYDLQRVEVLRGPQGTLYGRNATAGVVNIISQKPKFVAEAKLSGDVSNFNSSRLEGMVNIPLVEDKVALRLAGAWTKRDGYAVNELNDHPIDGRDLWSTRLSLRVQPSDRLDMNLIWEHFEEDDDRLRSGKQLCHRDLVDEVGGVPVTDYFQVVPANGQGASLAVGVHASFSQGCDRHSLYSQDSFGTPVGLMLPYYNPLRGIGLPAARNEPYVSATQSPDLRVIESSLDPTYRAKNDLGELQISFDLTDALTLSSETAFAFDHVYSMQDFNRFNTAPGAWETLFNGQPNRYVEKNILTPEGEFCDPQLGCSDRLVAVDISTADATQFSQEFRLSSNFEGPFNFSLGANYLRGDSVDKYYVFINSISLMTAYGIGTYADYQPNVTDNIDCLMEGYAPGNPFDVFPLRQCTYMDPNPIESVNDQGHNYFLSKNPYKLISYAVFGEAYYNITDTLKITAGLRWTVDKKDAPIVPSWIFISQSVGYPVAQVIEQEWREPTGRLTADWKPDFSFTDETLLYASYAHGYKAGGANPPGFVRNYYGDSGRVVSQLSVANSVTRPKAFDPEFVDAFEVGSKNTLLNGRATVNLAAFYYDYKGYQISEIVDRSAFNRNVDATVWGIELESDWRLLENLRFGVKVGYEETSIADHEQAVDLMDRTAGREGWLVVRPFPTYPSSCILPDHVFVSDGVIRNPSGLSGGGQGPCEYAYQAGYDPVTGLPYVPNPTVAAPSHNFLFEQYTDYPGFNPLDASPGHNNGEGFFKNIGGNELPNAPNLTATITGDYTIPLPNDWLVNLHTDLHWQAESAWRIFQDHDYSTLDEYFTMNLAAIFVNEEHGWNIMAYIKNVTDETAITGAFLNSDDTGLTTNVFLTEPRLYGLRVTKAWTGGSLLGSLGASREGPYPLSVEVGGQLQRHDAPNTALHPEAADAFEGPLDVFDDSQARDLDWGDGGDVKVTWRPNSGPVSVAAAYRFGKTNGQQQTAVQQATDPVCAFNSFMASYCTDFVGHVKYDGLTKVSMIERADAPVYDRESYEIADFMVGVDIGLGGLDESTVSGGLRYAKLESATDAELYGIPEWRIPEGFYTTGYYPTHELLDLRSTADREFSGYGPQISWDAAKRFLDLDTGHVALEWSLGGGVLFGEQETTVRSTVRTRYYSIDPVSFGLYEIGIPTVGNNISPDLVVIDPPEDFRRTESATVPTVNASLGVSYKAGAFEMGAGYRWERYFDAIDGGYEDAEGVDRTIDGPFFKVSMGFGG